MSNKATRDLWKETNISLRTIAINTHKLQKTLERTNLILIEIDRRLTK